MVLGSGIRETEQTPFRIPDPGVKKAPDPGAVLSLTVDKVITIVFISGTCPVTGREPGGQQQLLFPILLTGHGRHRCDF